MRNLVADPAALTVVQADSDVLRFEADPHRDPPDEREVDVSGLRVIPNEVTLPRVGDEAVVLGLSCELAEESYARMSTAAGDLLFEGGFPPMCVQDDPPAGWEPPPRLRVRRPAHGRGRSCRAGSCSAEEWDVVLAADGGEIPLSFGEPQEATVGGRRFLALAYYAHDLGGCGVVDGVGPVASAFIAPLTEQ